VDEAATYAADSQMMKILPGQLKQALEEQGIHVLVDARY